MPQVAQQDYNVVKCKSDKDAAAYARLVRATELNTILDTLIDRTAEQNGISKVLAWNPQTNAVGYIDGDDMEITYYSLPYTATQYEGLAAIQDAIDDYSDIPQFEEDEGGFLNETALGAGVVGVDGKKLSVTVSDDDKIAALSISDEEGADVDISWEDAQKLIGLPIS